MPLSLWDILLIAAVGIQGTVLAYLPSPRWKAFLITLPVPFTLATLAIGEPVNSANLAGLVLMLGFYLLLRVLHVRLRVPIVISIGLAALAYIACGAALLPVLPEGSLAFWSLAGVVLTLAILLMRTLPHRIEPSHVTPLPVWVKTPAVLAVVTALVLMKSWLGGFMTVFPMVGVISAYEARHSLWTMLRQVPVVMLTLGVLIVTIRLTQEPLGLALALIPGWVAFSLLLTTITRHRWRKESQL
jgi:hypothetical protein